MLSCAGIPVGTGHGLTKMVLRIQQPVADALWKGVYPHGHPQVPHLFVTKGWEPLLVLRAGKSINVTSGVNDKSCHDPAKASDCTARGVMYNLVRGRPGLSRHVESS
jgi:hypothetical protein